MTRRGTIIRTLHPHTETPWIPFSVEPRDVEEVRVSGIEALEGFVIVKLLGIPGHTVAVEVPVNSIRWDPTAEDLVGWLMSRPDIILDGLW